MDNNPMPPAPNPSPDPIPPIPVIPTVPDGNGAKKDNSNLWLGVMAVLLLMVISGVIWVYTTPQNGNDNLLSTLTSAKAPPAPTFTPTPVPTVALVEKYDNPFEEKVQYENPFEENVNPFDVLTL